jgi:hypothetical protein
MNSQLRMFAAVLGAATLSTTAHAGTTLYQQRLFVFDNEAYSVSAAANYVTGPNFREQIPVNAAGVPTISNGAISSGIFAPLALGLLSGGTFATGNSVNNSGDVVGRANDAQSARATLWRGANAIPTAVGDGFGYATAIHTDGSFTGIASTVYLGGTLANPTEVYLLSVNGSFPAPIAPWASWVTDPITSVVSRGPNPYYWPLPQTGFGLVFGAEGNAVGTRVIAGACGFPVQSGGGGLGDGPGESGNLGAIHPCYWPRVGAGAGPSDPIDLMKDSPYGGAAWGVNNLAGTFSVVGTFVGLPYRWNITGSAISAVPLASQSGAAYDVNDAGIAVGTVNNNAVYWTAANVQVDLNTIINRNLDGSPGDDIVFKSARSISEIGGWVAGTALVKTTTSGRPFPTTQWVTRGFLLKL